MALRGLPCGRGLLCQSPEEGPLFSSRKDLAPSCPSLQGVSLGCVIPWSRILGLCEQAAAVSTQFSTVTGVCRGTVCGSRRGHRGSHTARKGYAPRLRRDEVSNQLTLLHTRSSQSHELCGCRQPSALRSGLPATYGRYQMGNRNNASPCPTGPMGPQIKVTTEGLPGCK